MQPLWVAFPFCNLYGLRKSKGLPARKPNNPNIYQLNKGVDYFSIIYLANTTLLSLIKFGAGGGGRTRTVSLPPDFESGTSANSITPAYGAGDRT